MPGAWLPCSPSVLPPSSLCVPPCLPTLPCPMQCLLFVQPRHAAAARPDDSRGPGPTSAARADVRSSLSTTAAVALAACCCSALSMQAIGCHPLHREMLATAVCYMNSRQARRVMPLASCRYTLPPHTRRQIPPLHTHSFQATGCSPALCCRLSECVQGGAKKHRFGGRSPRGWGCIGVPCDGAGVRQRRASQLPSDWAGGVGKGRGRGGGSGTWSKLSAAQTRAGGRAGGHLRQAGTCVASSR